MKIDFTAEFSQLLDAVRLIVRQEVERAIASKPKMAQASTEKLAYSIKDAAQATGLKEAFLYKCVRDGRLSAYEAGGAALRIQADDLSLFIRGQRGPDDAPALGVNPSRAERRRPKRLRQS